VFGGRDRRARVLALVSFCPTLETDMRAVPPNQKGSLFTIDKNCVVNESGLVYDDVTYP